MLCSKTQTTCSCSRTARRLQLQIARNTYRVKNHLNWACDVASRQSRLETGILCSVWSPAAASVLRWLFETVEQVKQTIVEEWCSLSQKFIDRTINEWRRRLKCLVQQYGNFSVVGYTRHFCYISTTVNAHLWIV